MALDTATAGLLGACDGELGLGQIVRTVAGLLGADDDALTREAVVRVRMLVAERWLS
jgi:hypothetical protein